MNLKNIADDTKRILSYVLVTVAFIIGMIRVEGAVSETKENTERTKDLIVAVENEARQRSITNCESQNEARDIVRDIVELAIRGSDSPRAQQFGREALEALTPIDCDTLE